MVHIYWFANTKNETIVQIFTVMNSINNIVASTLSDWWSLIPNKEQA